MTLSWMYALRELRSGLSGFRIFLACLALGVAALAAAGSTAEAFRQGLASQARGILGGDVAVSVQGRLFSAQERGAFAAFGRTTDTVRVNAMAAGGGDRRLVEVRGVDDAYPLSGSLTLTGADSLSVALHPADGLAGAAVEPDLLDHLHLKLGERFLIGDVPFRVGALISNEPDRLGRGFALGPGVLISKAVLDRSGLIGSDALFGETVRIVLTSSEPPAAVAKALTSRFPNGGFRARGRNEAAAGLGRLIDQLEFFLSFIGLAALLAGGLGVSSAVSTYLDAKKPSIAILKAVGADGALIRNVYLIQIGALATLGILIGLMAGAASPFVLGWIAKNRLPVPVLFAIYPQPLLLAAAFGALAALAFSLVPLARARTTPPSSLFRRDLAGRAGFGPELLALAACVAGLGWLTVATAPTPIVAISLLAGVLGAFGLLWLVGQAATRVAGPLRTLVRGPWRMGLANLAGPASAARTASPSIGFGVALLTAVVLIQSSLLAQVRDVAPRTAPSLVFTQIPSDAAPAFDQVIAGVLGVLTPDRYRRFPFLTGRIAQSNGLPIDKTKVDQAQRWAFDADITMSALGAAPPDAAVVQGQWWPSAYDGPPLVMIDRDIAKAAGFKVGDELTLEVLGRDLETHIAGFRKVEWSGFGASFPVIISADTLQGANLRQIAIAKTSQRQEQLIIQRLAGGFPTVNIISVREQLESIAKIFGQLAWAIRGAAGVAALAGLFVLIGAIAATARARTREAAILKVLGAARAQILLAYCVEYGVVGLIAGGTGVLLGAAAAYPIITLVFHSRWVVDWSGIVVILTAVAGLATLGGAAGAYLALARHPSPVLRSAD